MGPTQQKGIQKQKDGEQGQWVHGLLPPSQAQPCPLVHRVEQNNKPDNPSGSFYWKNAALELHVNNKSKYFEEHDVPPSLPEAGAESKHERTYLHERPHRGEEKTPIHLPWTSEVLQPGFHLLLPQFLVFLLLKVSMHRIPHKDLLILLIHSSPFLIS